MIKTLAEMIRYTSQNELDLATFEELFKHIMDRNNRWVKLADALPWDKLAEIYMQSLCSDNGRPTIDVRLAVGALIIKHKLKLTKTSRMQAATCTLTAS